MSRFLTALAMLLSLSGCASPPAGTLPVGSLRLESAITVPPGAATVRLQYGLVTAFNAVQEQDPFCVFELETVSDGVQAVAPAAFDIAYINRSIETFAGMPVLPFRTLRVAAGQDDGGPSQIYYKTVFRLAPNPHRARSLTCMSNQYVPGIAIMRHLTLAEMRQALGGYFTLDLSRPR